MLTARYAATYSPTSAGGREVARMSFSPSIWTEFVEIDVEYIIDRPSTSRADVAVELGETCSFITRRAASVARPRMAIVAVRLTTTRLMIETESVNASPATPTARRIGPTERIRTEAGTPSARIHRGDADFRKPSDEEVAAEDEQRRHNEVAPKEEIRGERADRAGGEREGDDLASRRPHDRRRVPLALEDELDRSGAAAGEHPRDREPGDHVHRGVLAVLLGPEPTGGDGEHHHQREHVDDLVDERRSDLSGFAEQRRPARPPR